MTRWRIWTPSVDEADALVKLEAHAFGKRSWGRDSVAASFAEPTVSILLGGGEETDPLGFALWRDLGGEAELLTIGVAPSARKDGLGEALLSAVLAASKDAGAIVVFLEVDGENAAALSLYKKAGFTQIGLRQGYYRDGADAVVMRLEL